MPPSLEIPLESIRTDGWFERIGEGIGSFQALCDIIGTRFFGFAMITGARITALTVDRRNPDNTLVDFVVGPADVEVDEADAQRLTLADFRRRLVAALVMEEPTGPAPTRATDIEAVQLYIGVRYLLLAPLYGYSLTRLLLADRGATLALSHDGLDQTFDLDEFRFRIRTHVREELDRVQRPGGRGSIDLGRVAEAEAFEQKREWLRIVELLGAWPAPLAIFLRTPEGQLLGAESKGMIARGLGSLGTACIQLGEIEKGEEVLRLAVQYAGDGPSAPEIFARLGESMVKDERYGEAIGPLRRAVNLGADGARVWPLLAEAFSARGRHVAAYAALVEARAAGVAEPGLEQLGSRIDQALGGPLQAWKALVEG